ncbi:hypothetical protein [Endozoicomonas euniceicola]|uniref:Capsular biosynthesis protein n=1 Tax=Endozoicomonas euniceicola TaxID=1234143 RepID=A0ABY6H310_9GAMM|nr:hypothetical protein [Endozoicomonas euniceicola]UYM18514.1 hypothetical protein NX720_11630 [Endozoicomonas euniceicola]
MILITSGAYVSADLSAEIGRLPPSFLPVGNKRLFTLQLEQLASANGDIYLSIPAGYAINDLDRQFFRQHDVSLIEVPENLTLGESILYCWNCTGKQYNKLQVLHGDTLIYDLDFNQLDTVSVAENQGFYHRATASNGPFNQRFFKDSWAGDGEWVVSGFFAFSKPHQFIQGIVKSQGDFIQGLKHYSEKTPLAGKETGKWFDFGHINTFFQSRTLITTQRAFNEMRMTTRTVTKASSNGAKMKAEANWFSSLPGSLRIYTPHLIEDKTDTEAPGYSLEYLYLLPLNDLFVFGELPANGWRQIFRSCINVNQHFRRHKPDTAVDYKQFENLYLPKTNARLNQFAEQADFDIHKPLTINGIKVPSLVDIAKRTSELIPEADESITGISHGDFCFSNILYDPRVQSIKLIDPRGIDNDGELTIYGDTRYDIAKLHHSVIGLYDLIIANRFELDADISQGNYSLDFPDLKRVAPIQEIYRHIVFGQSPATERYVLAITIHLFLSMLPLHFDRPQGQLAMIANALRLYVELQDMDKLNFEASV